MNVKKLVKEKQVTILPMGALLNMYQELAAWKRNGSILTLFFDRAIQNFMNHHREEIEAVAKQLKELNDKYFKTTNDGVFLKDPQGQLIPKETADMEEYENLVKPILNKEVEVML